MFGSKSQKLPNLTSQCPYSISHKNLSDRKISEISQGDFFFFPVGCFERNHKVERRSQPIHFHFEPRGRSGKK